MTASSFDQQAWLNRIGYTGSLEPTLSALHQLIFAHAHAIAYELLDIMLGRTPRLDLPSLQHKMIAGGRGDIAWSRTCSSGKVFARSATR